MSEKAKSTEIGANVNVSKSLEIPKTGTPQRGEGGKFITGPPNPPFANREFAKAAITKRWRDSERDAQAGMLAAAQAKGLVIARPGQAWSAIVEAQSGLALSGKGRASTNSATFVGRASGYLNSDRRNESISLEGSTEDLIFAAVLRLMGQIHASPEKQLSATQDYLRTLRGNDE